MKPSKRDEFLLWLLLTHNTRHISLLLVAFVEILYLTRIRLSKFPGLQLYFEGCFIRETDVNVFAELGGAAGDPLPISPSRLDTVVIEKNQIPETDGRQSDSTAKSHDTRFGIVWIQVVQLKWEKRVLEWKYQNQSINQSIDRVIHLNQFQALSQCCGLYFGLLGLCVK